MKTIKYILLSTILIGFTACSDDDSNGTDSEPLPPLTAGSADFSKYVAVGASFSAGFTDNALFIAGQQNSFPNILSQQFANAGGGSFSQPLMSDNVGGLLFNGNPLLNPMTGANLFAPRLVTLGGPPLPIQSVNPSAVSTTEITNILTESFNNLGIPGAKSFHLLAPGYGNVAGVPLGLANPYYARMASSSTATILGDAVAQSPTFFTLSEIGGNDVLSYATSGGSGVYQVGNFNPATYGGNDITDPNVFAASFEATVQALTSNGAKGVVANVPYITSLPHFTTVPHNPIPLDAATAAFLNSASAYGAYNAGIQGAFAYLVGLGAISQADADLEIAKRTISFSASSNNAVVIIDEDLTNLTGINPALVSMRQATADDLLVLPASSFIGTEAIPGNPQTINGVAVPLADKWVLTPEEQMSITTATDLYNQSIAAIAEQYDLAIVDFKSILQMASTAGFSDGDFNFTTDLVTGGLVSLDGVHLTSRGYAVMANEFLKAIDAKYGSNFIAAGVKANVGNYPTNYPPTLQ
uniref:G-D-S-L family lipolytic protein n=1 Tax=Gelidibacter sp. TaxID=2018083 RepID=UPI004049D629